MPKKKPMTIARTLVVFLLGLIFVALFLKGVDLYFPDLNPIWYIITGLVGLISLVWFGFKKLK